ncbi:MAG: signal peptidase I [candidate division Zixibacteria bacterium]|nr:signal peptidase I [candidate division Zixibacteria bacterium]
MSASTSNALWDNTKQIVLAFLMAIVIKTSVVEAYKIPTGSMEDTLLVGDFLLANKFVYGARLPLVGWRLPAISDPEPGDIVIFIYPMDRSQTKYIKRCVATSGDTVEVKDKQLFVNGIRFPDTAFVKHTDKNIQPRGPGGGSGRDNFGPYVVPHDSYFMMGDNRDNSWDSRFWGPVRKELVLGEALMIHWSWDDTIHPSPEVTVKDPLSVPRLFLHGAIHFFEKVRWGRLFNVIS